MVSCTFIFIYIGNYLYHINYSLSIDVKNSIYILKLEKIGAHNLISRSWIYSVFMQESSLKAAPPRKLSIKALIYMQRLNLHFMF